MSTVELATAYVQLIPSAKGIQGAIGAELDGPAGAAGKTAGAKAATGFGTQFAARAGLALAGAGAGAIGKGIADFSGFQTQMNEVFTLLPGISGDAMSKMTTQVQDFSQKFGVLPDKEIPALYQAISAGVPQDNLFAFLETAQKAARGGVTDLETSVNGISSVVNAYGPAVISATQASDVMFTGVRLGKTTFEELSASLFQVIPSAASLGVKFGDVTAALATMTSQGVPTSVATTQLRQLLVELSKSGSAAAKTFQGLAGKDFRAFVASGGDVQGALKLMSEGASKSGKSITDLFGSVEAGNAALALTGPGAATFANNLDQMSKSAGATDAAFGKMQQGIGPKLDQLKAKFQVTFIKLGEALVPIALQVLPVITGIVNAFAALPAPVKTAVVLLATAAGGIAAVAKFAGPFVGAIRAVNGAMLLLAANPWVLAIAAGIAITVLLIKNWDKVKAVAKVVWGGIVTAVTTAGRAIATAAVAVAHAVSAAWDGIKSAASATWNAITTATSAAWNAIKTATTDVWNGITSFLSTVWTGIQTAASTVWAAVTTIIGTATSNIIAAWQGLSAFATSIWNGITGFVSGAVDRIQAVFTVLGIAGSAVWTSIKTTAGNAVDFLLSIPSRISNTFSGVADMIAGPFFAAFNGIATAWNKTVGGFSFKFPSGIPGIGGTSISIPRIPTFDSGGIVPGALGTPQLILAHAGETVLPTHRRGFALAAPRADAPAGGVNVAVTFAGPVSIRDDRDIVNLSRQLGDRIALDRRSQGKADLRS